mmetsp:Transcript_11652/g.21218  ORF Transcript_11652/g.21218 Transcript_11652/m.21218 type:complete len:242 (+) Transcript_11652:358-1083(+)
MAFQSLVLAYGRCFPSETFGTGFDRGLSPSTSTPSFLSASISFSLFSFSSASLDFFTPPRPLQNSSLHSCTLGFLSIRLNLLPLNLTLEPAMSILSNKTPSNITSGSAPPFLVSVTLTASSSYSTSTMSSVTPSSRKETVRNLSDCQNWYLGITGAAVLTGLLTAVAVLVGAAGGAAGGLAGASAIVVSASAPPPLSSSISASHLRLMVLIFFFRLSLLKSLFEISSVALSLAVSHSPCLK